MISGLLLSLFAKSLFDLSVVSFVLLFVGMAFCSLLGIVFYIVSGGAKADKDKEARDAVLNDEEKLHNEITKLKEDLLVADQAVASQQAAKLLLLLSDFRRVVKEKLGSSNLTHMSYVTESEKVFKLVWQNLKDILTADISIETLEEREKVGIAIPRENIELVNKQRAYILSIIEVNKELLNALNTISVEVASIKDISDFEYKESMVRLKELRDRAKTYSKI